MLREHRTQGTLWRKIASSLHHRFFQFEASLLFTLSGWIVQIYYVTFATFKFRNLHPKDTIPTLAAV